MSLTLGHGPLAGSTAGPFNFELDQIAPKHRLFWHPEQRRLRARFDGETILDTTRAQLLFETRLQPVIYAPLEDYRMDLFTPTDRSTRCPFKGEASYWTLTLPNERAEENILWAYKDPKDESKWLDGYAALYDRRVDEWLVEDDRQLGHLRDPFHRVDTHDSSREVVVTINDEEVVRTNRPKLIFETGLPVRVYVAPTDIKLGTVTAGSGLRTICPYKGEASYWTVGGIEDGAWSYDLPLPDALKAAGCLSFDSSKDGISVTLDGVAI